MKIAVLGGGTAGFIAAAHVTKVLPDAELLHVFDSRTPTIGVGEGTTPRFPLWFEEVTGLGFPDLVERCGATLKNGTRFEGWGTVGSAFVNRFQPTRLIGYHFDATQVVALLAEYVRAERVDARVEGVRTAVDGVQLRLAGNIEHRCDYVFDARGFPNRVSGDSGSSEDFIKLDWIPTGRAILRWLPPQGSPGSTRACARPHGWVFQIPLQDRTSAGYIFNPDLSADEHVEADFTAFLRDEGVGTWTPRGSLNFPNFLRRRWFDGRVFWIGNSASFLEPLEATAIGTAIVQVRAAAHWIAEHGPDSSGWEDDSEREEVSDEMMTYILRNSLFVAWHYACGSRWNTAFWQYARRGLERAGKSAAARDHLAAMEEFLEAGRSLPGPALAACEDQEQWDREVYPLLRVHRPFGNFSELNFAQVGHGIGFYDTPHGAATQPAAASR